MSGWFCVNVVTTALFIPPLIEWLLWLEGNNIDINVNMLLSSPYN